MSKQTFTFTREQLTQVLEGTINLYVEYIDPVSYTHLYSTFEEYCQKRWGMQRNYANKMIAASEVIQNLGTIVPILPTTESQVRPLTKLEPEEQTIVWQRATETAPNGKVTAAHVQSCLLYTSRCV